MAASGSSKVVVVAFFGNLGIALSKMTAALITGSSAMFAEAAHSFVDTGNQLLLLVGLKRAKRPADARHPFGYGKEIYFWSFVVAILLFSLGAGVSIYEGVEKIREPHPVESAWVNFVVLGLAAAFEGYAFRAAWKEMNKHRRPGEGVFGYVRRSKDAALFTVLFEDTAALIGIAIAFVGLAGAQIFDAPALDGWASLGIGCLLATAAILLSIETKGLLIGEAAEPELVARVKEIAEADERVRRVNEVRTMHLGPDDVLVAASFDFIETRTAGDVEAAVTTLEKQVKAEFPKVRNIFIEAQNERPAHPIEPPKS